MNTQAYIDRLEANRLKAEHEADAYDEVAERLAPPFATQRAASVANQLAKALRGRAGGLRDEADRFEEQLIQAKESRHNAGVESRSVARTQEMLR